MRQKLKNMVNNLFLDIFSEKNYLAQSTKKKPWLNEYLLTLEYLA